MASAKVTANFLFLKIWLFSVIIAIGECERVKEKIYDKIQADMACFKRFNGTHEIGCTSKFSGNIGVIHYINTTSDLDWVYDKGPHHPYILALTPQFLTVDVLTKAQDSGKVSGVVVLIPEDFDRHESLASGFSGDYSCPNEEYGLYHESSDPKYSEYCSKKPWNPEGQGLLYTSWDFPIFLIDNKTSVENIVSCYVEFNEPIDGEPRDWPLCALELKSNMFGTTNTEVCMRRAALLSFFAPINFCDPLYDYNIWGTIKPMNASQDLLDKSVIVVAARMDAATMYDNISPGAESAASGMVTLLSVAEALNRHREDILNSDNAKNILFILFQGEVWDYIGSSRVVYDMERGEFPFPKSDDDMSDQVARINFTHIDYFIEISQVGKMADNRLYLHSDPISNSNAEIRSETETLIKAFIPGSLSNDITFEEVEPDTPLPPASFQSFLKRANISGLVIADHKEDFQNRYYQSVFDDDNNIKDQDITSIASSLASTLYMLLGMSGKIEADREFTEDLLHCYTKNVSCQTFKDLKGYYLKDAFFDDKPARLYVSVKRGESGRTYLTNNVFAKVLGEKVDKNETECKFESLQQINQLYYFPDLDNGSCYSTTVRKTVAVSPAFTIKDYDWQSGEYSTWAESGWQSMDAMLFLRPSVIEEVALVCGGVFSTVVSFLLVYFMNARSDLLFGLSTPPAAAC